MRFAPTVEALDIRDVVRDVLAGRCRPDDVRAAFDPAAEGYDRALWTTLADLGVAGLLGPEGAGGLGLSAVEAALVLEEFGTAALPGPLAAHLAVAVPALTAAGSARLPDAVTGALVVAVGERSGEREAVVPWAEQADHILVAGPDRVVAVDPTRVQRRDTVDRAHRSATVHWSEEEVLDGVDPADVRDHGALATAAQLIGLARRMLDMTVEYAGARTQFGAPIGSFQAVKHHLADALLQIEYARPVVHRAAYALAHGEPDRSRDCSAAKFAAARAADLAGRKALQVHGAIGYSFEHDLHLWLKRSWALSAEWGTPERHRTRVADALLG